MGFHSEQGLNKIWRAGSCQERMTLILEGVKIMSRQFVFGKAKIWVIKLIGKNEAFLHTEDDVFGKRCHFWGLVLWTEEKDSRLICWQSGFHFLLGCPFLAKKIETLRVFGRPIFFGRRVFVSGEVFCFLWAGEPRFRLSFVSFIEKFAGSLLGYSFEVVNLTSSLEIAPGTVSNNINFTSHKVPGPKTLRVAKRSAVFGLLTLLLRAILRNPRPISRFHTRSKATVNGDGDPADQGFVLCRWLKK